MKYIIAGISGAVFGALFAFGVGAGIWHIGWWSYDLMRGAGFGEMAATLANGVMFFGAFIGMTIAIAELAEDEKEAKRDGDS